MQIANHNEEKWTFFHQFNLGPDFLVYSFSEITLLEALNVEVEAKREEDQLFLLLSIGFMPQDLLIEYHHSKSGYPGRYASSTRSRLCGCRIRCPG